MLGANALLYRVTGRAAHLTRAHELAQAVFAHYGATGLADQPLPFNAIFFRNLLLLQATDPSVDYRPPLAAYADALWSARRDPATGLFRAAPGAPFALLDQAAAVQLFALLAWDPNHYSLLA